MVGDRGHRGRWGALAGALLVGVLVAGEGMAPTVAAAPLGLPLPAVLITVTVTPPVATVAAGSTQQFTATGTYSDLSTRDITASVSWTTSDATIATVGNSGAAKGNATGVAAGAATITATDASGTLGTAALAVTPPVELPPVELPPVEPPPVELPPILPPVSPPPATRALTPNTGGPFTEVRIKGTLFPAARRIRVQYETGTAHPKRVRLCKTVTTTDGNFTCYARIPGDALAGRTGAHPVLAKILRRPKVAPVSTTFVLTR